MPKSSLLACETCRKKKIKCSGGPAPCSKCKQSHSECVFPTVSKPRRNVIRSSRRIDGIEERLARIESLLKDVIRPTESEDSSAVIAPPLAVDAGVIDTEPLNHPEASTAAEEEPDNGSPSISSTSQYPSNPASSLSPLSDALELARRYFETFNRFMPLFEESVLVNGMREHSSSLETADPALWTAVNVIFSLSHQAAACQVDLMDDDHNAKASVFAHNAISRMEELVTGVPSMLSAQALLGIAKVWQATSSPDVAIKDVLVMATQQIYQLGLNELPDGSESDVDRLEWRHRLLWMAYTMDREHSLRLDLPHTLHEADVNFNTLPSWTPKDDLGFLPSKIGQPRINYFRFQANLSIIQSAISRRLESIQNPDQFQTDYSPRTDSICDLVVTLETWKNQIPVNFQPISLMHDFPPTSAIALVTLYLGYFNGLTMIHRLSFWKVGHLEAYRRSLEEAVVNICPSHRMCFFAARTALHLFTVIPRGDVPCIWMLNDYFVSAVLMLLTGVLYDSFLSMGWADLQLVDPVIENLATLSRHGDCERLQFIHANCLELQSAARNVHLQSDANAAQAVSKGPADTVLQVKQAYGWLLPTDTALQT